MAKRQVLLLYQWAGEESNRAVDCRKKPPPRENEGAIPIRLSNIGNALLSDASSHTGHEMPLCKEVMLTRWAAPSKVQCASLECFSYRVFANVKVMQI